VLIADARFRSLHRRAGPCGSEQPGVLMPAVVADPLPLRHQIADAPAYFFSVPRKDIACRVTLHFQRWDARPRGLSH
jgi:hypothetical protein